MRLKVLKLTESARKHLEARRIQENRKYVYLALQPSGCAGFEYKWDYNDSIDSGDLLIDNLLVVGHNALLHVQGSTVDLSSDLVGSYLNINNPNVQTSCGCGVSFSV